jgi:hypothetical protein
MFYLQYVVIIGFQGGEVLPRPTASGLLSSPITQVVLLKICCSPLSFCVLATQRPLRLFDAVHKWKRFQTAVGLHSLARRCVMSANITCSPVSGSRGIEWELSLKPLSAFFCDLQQTSVFFQARPSVDSARFKTNSVPVLPLTLW